MCVCVFFNPSSLNDAAHTVSRPTLWDYCASPKLKRSVDNNVRVFVARGKTKKKSAAQPFFQQVFFFSFHDTPSCCLTLKSLTSRHACSQNRERRLFLPGTDVTGRTLHLSGSKVSVRRERGRSKWGEKKSPKKGLHALR